MSWYYFKRSDGKLEKRYILCTKALKGSTITRWIRRRCAIEGVSKQQSTALVFIDLAGQTLLGVYKWLILFLIAYLLAHWIYLYSSASSLPNWGEAAQPALELLLPQMALLPLSAEIQRLQPLAKRYGIDINVNWCKI